MLNLMKRFSLMFVAAGFLSTANASILLEPYLGYHTGKYEQGTNTGDFSGLTYGARFGFQQLGFMAGVDYMTGKWTDKESPSNDLTPSTIGVFAGYEFPMLLRVYAAYGFKDELKFKSSAGSGTYEGSGSVKLGVGFTFLPLLAVNLEYIMASYDEMDGNSLANKVTSKGYGLTVSLPFTF